MIFGKIDRYLLIAILIVGLVCLYFLFTNKKDTNDQSNLLISMAKKLDVSYSPDSEHVEKKVTQRTDVNPEKTQEEQEQIVAIADKLCFGHELTAEEKQFQKNFNADINKELADSRKILGAIIHKFLSGGKEFDEFEKEFYEFHQKAIDEIINHKKCFDSIIKKLTAGTTDFTEEELQFQQNYPKEIEQALSQIQKQSQSFKGANPPLAAGERLKTILTLFEDGIPKNNVEIARQYAEKTKTKINTGNMSTVLGNLNKAHNLISIKIGDKVYHGLPEWFDGNKLKSQYKQKITS